MFTLDRSTAAGILHSCAKKKDLSEGKRIHSLLLSSGQDDDARLGNLLITMYGKCGEITQAREVFHKLTHKNTRSWNVMIAAYAQNGHMLEAVELFNRMSQEGLEPDNYTYSAVLSVYTKALDVSNGRRVHERASTLGYASDAITASALVHLYGKCGSLEVARDVFEESVVREADAVGLWTSMMAAYSEHDRDSDAMRVYSRMLLEGVRPDPHTYVTVLNVCITLRDLKHGKGVHSCVKSQGLDSDPILATALLNMYGKCNSLGDASETFETLQRKDLICWNAMLAAYTQNDQGGEAFRLFRRMLQEGVKLDKFTLTTMVVCLSTLQEVEFMSSILKENPTIERSSLVLGNTLITMNGGVRVFRPPV